MHRRRFQIYGIFCFALYACFVAVFAGYATHRAKRECLESVDNRLLLAAESLKHMLAPDFHDRAVDEEAISLVEELRNREVVSTFARETDFEYVYTLAEKDGKFYFAAPTVTPEEAEERERWYFLPYDDIPEEFVAAFEEGALRFATYADQWGVFRSVALAETSPGGRRYLACADYDVSYIRTFLLRRCSFYVFAAMGFMMLSLPFILLTRRMYSAYNSGLLAVNRELSAHRDNLEQLVDARTAALRSAAKEARQASEAKTDFLNNVSHEMRTPLNAIIGFTEMILHAEPSGQARERASTILAESEGLLAIIDDILDHAKIEAGKVTIDAFPFELDALLSSIRANMDAQFHRKGLELRMDVASRVPSLLLGDAFRLRQVLLNLVGNAMKFTEQGNVTVRVTPQDCGGESIRLRFAVSDTGIGIRKERQEAIFDSFAQADGGTTRRFGGTGLGTTISQRLVSLMGGEMGLVSEIGQGSTFWFEVPLGVCSPDEAQRFADAGNADGLPDWLVPDYVSVPHDAAQAPESAAPSATILLAEDYEPNRQVAIHHLGAVGHTVEVATDGTGAVDACRLARFALVLMDIQMPGMDGYEATRRIRQLGGRYEDVPIIAMTAHADAKTRRLCLDSGFDDVITKPIRQRHLTQTVGRWLSKEQEHPGKDRAFDDAEPDDAAASLPLDYDEALYQFSNDRQVLHEVLDGFVEDLTAGLREMDRALDESDTEAIRHEAHKIKGGAGNLSAMHLSVAAAELEKAAASGAHDSLPGLIQRLMHETERFMEFWRRIAGDSR